ncbi:hypothetical protein TNIN_40381 [Trichonephila inaurata madagascariensis]|uniref:Uncharacterized protein n=1 Tax=Trichonephila inaurata madagascariensis TaxID=2747483 RepID=A0A8X6JQC5_9ARAC|nr:hypothetical protein TNIN_40381 [Trichonephila inaurata madagascariensis]
MPLSFEHWMWHYDHYGLFKNDLCSNYIVWSFGMIDRFKTAERRSHSQDFAIRQHETLAIGSWWRSNMPGWLENVTMRRRRFENLPKSSSLPKDG